MSTDKVYNQSLKDIQAIKQLKEDCKQLIKEINKVIEETKELPLKVISNSINK